MPGTTPLIAPGPGGKRLVRHAEGDDGDEAVQRRVVVVGDRVDAPEGGERSQPEVALLVAGAEHEVGAAQLLVQRGRGPAHGVDPAAGPARLSALLELLEVHRVVGVDDHRHRRGGQPGAPDHDPALEHDDIGPADQLLQVGVADAADLEVGPSHFTTRRRHQAHLVLPRQRGGDRHGSDGRPGHGRGEHVHRDDEDPPPDPRPLGRAVPLQQRDRLRRAARRDPSLDPRVQHRDELAAPPPPERIEVRPSRGDRGQRRPGRRVPPRRGHHVLVVEPDRQRLEDGSTDVVRPGGGRRSERRPDRPGRGSPPPRAGRRAPGAPAARGARSRGHPPAGAHQLGRAGPDPRAPARWSPRPASGGGPPPPAWRRRRRRPGRRRGSASGRRSSGAITSRR